MSDQQPLEYGRPEEPRGTHVPLPLGLAIIAAATVLLWFVIGPGTQPRAREKVQQVRCASNLRQIGLALRLYAVENGGFLPPDPQTLVASQTISLGSFVCPSTADFPAQNPGQLSAHHSYIYVAAGLSTSSKPECIVIIEDPANHNLEGSNALYADGHVEFLSMTEVQSLLNELNAGRNPPATLPATLSSAAAKQDYEKNWKPRMTQLKANVWQIPATQPAKPE